MKSEPMPNTDVVAPLSNRPMTLRWSICTSACGRASPGRYVIKENSSLSENAGTDGCGVPEALSERFGNGMVASRGGWLILTLLQTIGGGKKGESRFRLLILLAGSSKQGKEHDSGRGVSLALKFIWPAPRLQSRSARFLDNCGLGSIICLAGHTGNKRNLVCPLGRL